MLEGVPVFEAGEAVCLSGRGRFVLVREISSSVWTARREESPCVWEGKRGACLCETDECVCWDGKSVFVGGRRG